MGYLVDTCQTLSFPQTKALAKYIKEHGIIQFLHLYKQFKDKKEEKTLWGDEIELHLLNIDPETKIPRLQLNTEYMFSSLNSELFSLQPEFGAWMLETVPLKAYDLSGDPNVPLQNFKARRRTIKSLCQNGDVLFAGTVFPLMEVGDYFVSKKNGDDNSPKTQSKEEEKKEESKADYLPESHIKKELLNPHPRYSTICTNVRMRRGENLCVLVPIYQDENTSMEKTETNPYPGFIHMDEMLFGSGNTSLQITFGTKDVEEARYLVDQLSVLSSIMLPLSAASPIFKGKLADVDARWNMLSACVDDRTKEERDPQDPKYIPKSRWASVSRYISHRPQCKEEYNDVHFPLEDEMLKFIKEKAKELDVELDDRLVNHLGFVFRADPLIAFSDRIYVDDTKMTNHFENLQSSNWNNVRFKPPPSFDSEIGWRVELRTMEAQLTAEESVALAMFSFFVARMIIKYDLNFYIPISKVDENIERGHKRNAVINEKFWFRKNLEKDSDDEWIELTMDEILHGKKDTFVGLFPLIYKFCKEEYNVDMQEEWKKKQENNEYHIYPIVENMKYFEILSKRAKGERPTIAKWIRNFVSKHPKYKKDSIISAEITADLIEAITTVSDGMKKYEDFQ